MPTVSDFIKAIQKKSALHDNLGGIREGEIRRNVRKMPMSNAGTFAVVFQTQVGTERWALRCFMQPSPDLQQRYQLLREHLHTYPCPFFVNFDLHVPGLLVNEVWEPLMTMEWLEGQQLHDHVEGIVGDRDALLQLSADWISMFDRLRVAGLAHGDIHHQNVLVADGRLRLVDYDAVWTESLSDNVPKEGGQPNYQHPRPRRYGPHMDHFPSWLVYYSLLALSVDPSLWDRFDGGDQTLLFRREDFLDPDGSRLLRAMRDSSSSLLNLIDADIRSFLLRDPDTVRPLSRASVMAAGLPLPPQPSIWWASSPAEQEWVRRSNRMPRSGKSWVSRRT